MPPENKIVCRAEKIKTRCTKIKVLNNLSKKYEKY
jgi:hypothetical protein